MCEEPPMKTRRSIKNIVVLFIAVLAAVVAGFEFGSWSATKNQFVEPGHFEFNAMCAMTGGDQKLCSCIEKDLVSEFGRFLDQKGLNEVDIDNIVKNCIK
jgi:hypothetical protein